MAPVCEALLAKLNELMDFLRFARLPSAGFRGAVRRCIVNNSRTELTDARADGQVTFMFSASSEDRDEVACIRTIDMRRGLEIDNTTLHPEDPFLPEVAVVHVSLADFLYMYSGEASAGEIASMVLSGRVAVAWSAYGKLKAFAECFDFSTDKWDAYYADLDARGVSRELAPCTNGCCAQSTKEEIDANWLLVSDATTTNGGGDWEVVSDLQCLTVSKEQREEMEQISGVAQLDEWFARLWSGTHRLAQNQQTSVKNSLQDLKDMAGKFFVSLEA
jgi:hypothetical protein